MQTMDEKEKMQVESTSHVLLYSEITPDEGSLLETIGGLKVAKELFEFFATRAVEAFNTSLTELKQKIKCPVHPEFVAGDNILNLVNSLVFKE